jgi:methylmalonyl-CoA/ethylmalonyl-CoA epimerase
MITSIDHIGIAVTNLEQAKELYRTIFNVDEFHEETVHEQLVSIASFLLGGVRIELTAATSPESPIGSFISKRGEGIHHIAFKSDSINEDLARLSNDGLKLINEKPVQGAHNMMIAFVHPKSTNGVLMELCSENK